MSATAALFPAAYTAARAGFLHEARNAGAAVESYPHPEPGPDGEGLALSVVQDADFDASDSRIEAVEVPPNGRVRAVAGETYFEVDAESVTFHLERPDPDLGFKLALPVAFPVPVAIPMKDQGFDPVPATGPYMIASYRPGHSLSLARNPRFQEWSKAAQPDGYPDEIAVEIGGTPDEAVDAVIRGEADAFSTAQSSLPRRRATRSVRQAPTPDASIGVNIPAYMPPIVMAMMAMMAID